MRRARRGRCIGLLALASALAACASAPPRNPVTVKVVDFPNAVDRLYRYVEWNGERYSGGAFVIEARRVGVDAVVLLDPNEARERCIAAAARELRAKAYRRTPDGRDERLGASGRPVDVACDIGDGNIRVGEDYFRHRIARAGSQVVLDDGPAIDASVAVAALTKQRARSLVAPRSNAEDLLCFDAIAREAQVRLYEAGADGVLVEARVGAAETAADACAGKPVERR